MDARTIRQLNNVNAAFYAAVHESFSETRRNAWPGWERALAAIEEADPAFVPRVVADLACGNLRFVRFVLERTAEKRGGEPGTGGACEPRFVTFDNCRMLLPNDVAGTHVELDIVEGLLNGASAGFAEGGLPAAPDVTCASAERLPLERALCEHGPFDLAVAFGFMHHIPSKRLRTAFLRTLAGSLRPGGFAVVSFWRFMDDAKIAAKARACHDEALAQLVGQGLAANALEPHDWLLGWGESSAVRYCHHFPACEIEELASAVSDMASVVRVFDADGRSGALNRYLVLQAQG